MVFNISSISYARGPMWRHPNLSFLITEIQFYSMNYYTNIREMKYKKMTFISYDFYKGGCLSYRSSPVNSLVVFCSKPCVAMPVRWLRSSAYTRQRHNGLPSQQLSCLSLPRCSKKVILSAKYKILAIRRTRKSVLLKKWICCFFVVNGS